MPRKMITAIYDNVAKDIIGPLQVFPHGAPAIRMFADIAADKRTQVGQHPEDYDLILLGYLDDDVTAGPSIEAAENPLGAAVITGRQWLASQNTNQENTP